MADTRTVALAQLAPVWLNKKATLHKMEEAIREATR
jgi:nitrilase